MTEEYNILDLRIKSLQRQKKTGFSSLYGSENSFIQNLDIFWKLLDLLTTREGRVKDNEVETAVAQTGRYSDLETQG